MAEYEEVAVGTKGYKSFVPEDDLKLWASTHVKRKYQALSRRYFQCEHDIVI